MFIKVEIIKKGSKMYIQEKVSRDLLLVQLKDSCCVIPLIISDTYLLEVKDETQRESISWTYKDICQNTFEQQKPIVKITTV